MKYTIDQDRWLIDNRSKYTLKELTTLFNEKYNTKLEWSAIKSHCQKVLRLKKEDYWNNERDNFLKEYVPNHSAVETHKEYEKRFGTIKLGTLVNHCNYRLGLFFKLYSEEETEWLKNFYPYNSANKTHEEFEKRFRKIKKNTLISQCTRLGLIREGYHFTEEEKEWLKENYETCFSSADLFKEFEKKFGHYHSYQGFLGCTSRLGLDKRSWKKEETEWLLNNYQRNEKLRVLYQEFNNLFPNRKTYDAFCSRGKELGLGCPKRGKFKRGELHYKTKLKIDMGVPLDNFILSDLGNGDFLGIEKDIYSTMRHIKGALRNGEITKTYYEICKAKQVIKEIKNGNK